MLCSGRAEVVLDETDHVEPVEQVVITCVTPREHEVIRGIDMLGDTIRRQTTPTTPCRGWIVDIPHADVEGPSIFSTSFALLRLLDVVDSLAWSRIRGRIPPERFPDGLEAIHGQRGRPHKSLEASRG